MNNLNESEINYSYVHGLRKLALTDGRPLFSETFDRIKITLPTGGNKYDAPDAIRAVNNVLQAAGRGERVTVCRTSKGKPSVRLLTAGGKFRKLEQATGMLAVVVKK